MRVSTRGMMALAGATAMAGAFLVACSGGEDEAAVEGSTAGGRTPVAERPTETPVVIDDPTPPTVGGAASAETPPAPPSFPASDGPPVTTARANGDTVDMGIGTYCWTQLCVDKVGVPTEGTLTVSGEDRVTVAVPDGAPPLTEVGAYVFRAADPQPLEDGGQIWPYVGTSGVGQEHVVSGDSVEVAVDLEPGQYVLAVGMFFVGRDVVYGVLLDVQ